VPAADVQEPCDAVLGAGEPRGAHGVAVAVWYILLMFGAVVWSVLFGFVSWLLLLKRTKVVDLKHTHMRLPLGVQ